LISIFVNENSYSYFFNHQKVGKRLAQTPSLQSNSVWAGHPLEEVWIPGFACLPGMAGVLKRKIIGRFAIDFGCDKY
jgi:hypothetical protein